jgi:hypothetical protein
MALVQCPTRRLDKRTGVKVLASFFGCITALYRF